MRTAAPGANGRFAVFRTNPKQTTTMETTTIEPAVADRPDTMSPAVGLASDTGAPLDVLMVDDDPSLLELLAFQLRRMGHVVRVASDGQEALRMMARRRPSLVITDYNMPVMDGAALTRAMRESSHLRAVPVIMSSGMTEDCVREHGAVYDAYVQKPLSFEALQEVMAGSLEARGEEALDE